MLFMEHWRREKRPIASEFSGTCIAPFNYMHLDMLMKDMGLRTKLTRWPHEYLKPINPSDYHKLLNKEKNGIQVEKTTNPYAVAAVEEPTTI